MKDLGEAAADDFSGLGLPARFVGHLSSLILTYRQRKKEQRKKAKTGADIVHPVFFKNGVELRDHSDVDLSPFPKFDEWLQKKKISNEEERAHELRAEDRAIRFLTGYVDGVQRRFAHDITLFAACAVFDPSRRSSYDALSAAKCLSVLTQSKYFPDIITAEVFASANAYFTPEPSPGENSENTQGSTRVSEKSLEEITVTEYYASLNQI